MDAPREIKMGIKENLLSLIDFARSKDECLYLFYFHLYFTPDELTECLDDPSFKYGYSISNWTTRKLPPHEKTYTGKTVLDLYGQEPDLLSYWKEKANRLELQIIKLKEQSNENIE